MTEADLATFSYEDGARAVELAREAVESFVQSGARANPGSMRDSFYARTGALVRLESTRGRGSLRGCAGCYITSDHLGSVIVEQAIAAASEESCGSAIAPPELNNLTVSVGLVGETIEPEAPAAELELGTHAVVVETQTGPEWLYPTMPLAQGWSGEEYLTRTLQKAGQRPTAWQNGDAPIKLVETTVFEEETPRGTVIRA